MTMAYLVIHDGVSCLRSIDAILGDACSEWVLRHWMRGCLTQIWLNAGHTATAWAVSSLICRVTALALRINGWHRQEAQAQEGDHCDLHCWLLTKADDWRLLASFSITLYPFSHCSFLIYNLSRFCGKIVTLSQNWHYWQVNIETFPSLQTSGPDMQV